MAAALGQPQYGCSLERASPALARPDLPDVERLVQLGNLGRLDVCQAARHPAGSPAASCRDGCYTGPPSGGPCAPGSPGSGSGTAVRLAGATLGCSSSDRQAASAARRRLLEQELEELEDLDDDEEEEEFDSDHDSWEEEDEEEDQHDSLDDTRGKHQAVEDVMEAIIEDREPTPEGEERERSPPGSPQQLGSNQGSPQQGSPRGSPRPQLNQRGSPQSQRGSPQHKPESPQSKRGSPQPQRGSPQLQRESPPPPQGNEVLTRLRQEEEREHEDIWDSLNEVLTDASSTSSLNDDADSVIFVAPRETFKCVDELLVAAQASLCLSEEQLQQQQLQGRVPGTGSPRVERAIEQAVVEEPHQGAVRSSSADSGVQSSGGATPEPPAPSSTVSAVVAIDLGTTHSGYAYSVCREPGRQVHVMRRWEGGDSGLVNHKTPTALLLTPKGDFHAFGSAAREAYLDLPAEEARRWLFFDRFKMELHRDNELHRDTPIPASNGAGSQPALAVFAHALRHLKGLALRELRERAGERCAPSSGAVRWVLTVPAMWRQPARQLVREAAYQAGLCDAGSAERLLVVLEPEAAAVQCREQIRAERMADAPSDEGGVRFLVADCGGGTVDITLHEMEHGPAAKLSELLPATGGPFGATDIDREFERLLDCALGADLMAQFRSKRPAAHAELMAAFEARKRGAAPTAPGTCTTSSRGVVLHPPYAFVDFLRKHTGKDVETLLRRGSSRHAQQAGSVTWCREGALRLRADAMLRLFQNTVGRVVHHVGEVLDSAVLASKPAHFLFLVGGFSESAVLQAAVREAFQHRLQVVAPQPSSLATLRGAVLYGLDASVISARRARHSYGVGVLTRFVPGLHPAGKLVVSRDGGRWCADVLDCLVRAGQTLAPGHAETRRYAAASAGQRSAVMHVYCAERAAEQDKPVFVTDPGVTRCGTLTLALQEEQPDEGEECAGAAGGGEVRTQIVCAGTELVVTATCARTGNSVKVHLDFLAAD